MRKIVLISFVILSAAVQMTHAQKQAVIKLTETTLMHEMRATPYPLDKAVVNDRAVSFQWPLRSDMNSQDSPLDGFEIDAYRISKIASETITAAKAGMIEYGYTPGAASTSALRKIKEGIKAVRSNGYNGPLVVHATPDFILELELELAGILRN